MLKGLKHLLKRFNINGLLCIVILTGGIIQLFSSVHGLTWPKSALDEMILYEIRLPRFILGLFSGMILAVTGAVFQQLFNNQLADSFSLGLASGSSFGSGVAIVAGFSLVGVTLTGLFFSLLTLAVVLMIAKRLFSRERSGIVLSGLLINFFFSSALYGLLLINPKHAQALMNYMFGSLNGAEWFNVILLFPLTALCFILLYGLARPIAIAASGDVTAKSVGIHVERLTYIALITSSVLTSALIAVTGIIGFVGLIVPQLVSRQKSFRQQLPTIGLLGAAAVSWADLIGQQLFYPVQIPVSIIVSFFGLPLLLILMLRSNLEERHHRIE